MRFSNFHHKKFVQIQNLYRTSHPTTTGLLSAMQHLLDRLKIFISFKVDIFEILLRLFTGEYFKLYPAAAFLSLSAVPRKRYSVDCSIISKITINTYRRLSLHLLLKFN